MGADTSEPPTEPIAQEFSVVIVGAGFAGIAMGAELNRRGRPDYVVLERGSDVGGTWRDNTYPGATCDIPSRLYSLSFAPNPNWSRTFSAQPEILDYLRRVAREHGVIDRCRFDVEVIAARWDPSVRRWEVATTAGRFRARYLIVGSGALSEPADPDLAGLASFAGPVFHSARWNHDVPLAGRRVAVIGTGASAVQIVPSIAGVTSHLDVYQRTPAWVMPRNDRAYRPLEKRLFRRLPVVARLIRAALYATHEAYVVMFAKRPRLAGIGSRIATRHLRRQVSDPELRRRLTPQFAFGCKRVLISSDYYPTLARDDVELVTSSIATIRPTAIVTVDGTEHPTDVIIFATGFHVTDSPIAGRIRDGDGVSLAERWQVTGMQALRGTTVPGYPNLFFIVGPNTGQGHTSMVYIIESQVAYISSALRAVSSRASRTLDARPDAARRYNEAVQSRLAPTVWNAGGCRSWYLDSQGRNSTLWPDFTFRYRGATRRVDLSEYELS
jgi:cation diffusion facilitator CzcD-associated flavoprotein CzcO